MSDINEGGPAFPLNGGTHQLNTPNCSGMTLRDYFAAKAMQAICSALAQGIRPGDIGRLGVDSYGIADAMLKARQA